MAYIDNLLADLEAGAEIGVRNQDKADQLFEELEMIGYEYTVKRGPRGYHVRLTAEGLERAEADAVPPHMDA